MKYWLSIWLLVAVYACKKDGAPGPTPQESFPFENDDLKMVVVSNNVPSSSLIDMLFLNEDTGFVSGYYGFIYKTVNGGASWELKYSPPEPDSPMRELLFTDEQTGYAVGGDYFCLDWNCTEYGGRILKTLDGGENWSVIYSENSEVQFRSITQNSEGDLFVLRNEFDEEGEPFTVILKSSDVGTSWNPVDTMQTQLFKIVFDGDLGFCVGGHGQATVFKSEDNGTHWNDSITFDGFSTGEISFADGSGFLVVDDLNVFKTTDHGESWEIVYQAFDHQTYQLSVLSDSACLGWGAGQWAGGNWGSAYGAVRQTTDGGNYWIESQFNDISEIKLASFYTPTEGYVMSDKFIRVTVK